MFLLLKIVLFVIAFGLLIPSTVLFLECLAAVLLNPSEREQTRQPLKYAVLIPAHNEASEIKTTLTTLLPQVATLGCIVVIADNCTDETAAITRQLGVTVIERQDPERRGKGYALDYGLQFLKADPPEVVVAVDADCQVQENTIDSIVQLAYATKRPVQAVYLMEQAINPRPRDVLSALAVKVKNFVRPYGLSKLGLPCLLMGSGMAFPWTVVHQVSFANSKTVDDMQLSIDLAIIGYPALYCSQGQVTGRLMEQEFARSQRSRWEHGHIETLFTQGPRLFKASITQRRFDLLALALELCVPPLSLLVMFWSVAMGIALLAGISNLSWLPSLILAITGLLIIFSIVGAWAKFGRADIPGLTLLMIPFYLVWKIPLYFAFLVRPQTRWIKTERDTKESSS